MTRYKSFHLATRLAHSRSNLPVPRTSRVSGGAVDMLHLLKARGGRKEGNKEERGSAVDFARIPPPLALPVKSK